MTRGTHVIATLIAVCLPATGDAGDTEGGAQPEAEFHMGRLMYGTEDASPGWRQWWAIDYPEAEYHLVAGLRRLTRVSVADDSRHLSLHNDEVFDYPWLFVQQVGKWHLSSAETDKLRKYLLRGGFLVVDDFHGPYEWEVFRSTIARVLPEFPIVDVTGSDPLMHVHFDLKQDTQIPGKRHLYRNAKGDIDAYLPGGQPHWRGIYDTQGRLIVAINHNMDMGDSWEHADDPYYPVPMTSLGYRFAVNYLIYAMTH